ncbi:MAG: hypothetical protein J5542_13465 [Bacteroidales bacterium]|nr:hypothetical protein [Bacteroidales bacterium]
MLRRIKTYARQTITRYGTGSVISRSLSVVEVRQYTRRLLTSFREAASSVPYKRTYTTRSLAGSFCFTE